MSFAFLRTLSRKVLIRDYTPAHLAVIAGLTRNLTLKDEILNQVQDDGLKASQKSKILCKNII